MKKKVILIVIVIIIFIIGVISFLPKSSHNPFLFKSIPSPTSIPFSNSHGTPNISVNPSLTQGSLPPLIKDTPGSDSKMINSLNNRQPLSDVDTNAKQQVVSTLGNDSGSPVSTQTYRVDYLKSGDFFEVEILTTDYQQAKKDAVAWFLSQGFTQDGICKLPLTFYLNWNIKKQLQGKNISFNPLPDGC